MPVVMHQKATQEQVDKVVQAIEAKAMAVGANGLMMEVHHQPEAALSDGAQSFLPEQFEQLCREVEPIFGLFAAAKEA
jgi:3-deoxy-7-phosphoheptulonate synthase